MKETIYTIPVTEAFTDSANGDCPFCHMYAKLDNNSIEFVMGPSYMEDDVRTDTNRLGFCARHMAEMYAQPNRLGLALMVHTHLCEVNRQLDKRLMHIDTAGKKKRFGKPIKQGSVTEAAVSYLKSIEHSCYICERTDRIFQKYIDTFFYLWGKDDGMRQLLDKCGGICLNHLYMLLEAGEAKLGASEYAQFVQTVVPFAMGKLKGLADDMEWFIAKFDYRNADAPWKNSRDALIRGLKHVSSVSVQ